MNSRQISATSSGGEHAIWAGVSASSRPHRPDRRTPACGDRGVHPCPPERLGVSLRRARGLLGHALLASDHRVRSGVESGLPPRSGIGLPGLRGRVAAYVVCGEFRRPRSAEVPPLTVRELVERYRTSLGSRGRRGQDRRRPHRASRTGGRRPDDAGRTESWDRLIEREPPIADRGYAVRFFLGHPTEAQAALADRDVRARDLLVADLNDLEHEDHSDVGPAGFVAAIARADLVVTDSFHASVFALMYRRPLLLRARFARDDRLATLLSPSWPDRGPDRRRRPGASLGRRLDRGGSHQSNASSGLGSLPGGFARGRAVRWTPEHLRRSTDAAPRCDDLGRLTSAVQ